MKKLKGVNMYEFFKGVYISEEKIEGRLIAVNEKFLTISLKEKGNILIVDSSKPKNIYSDLPYLKGNNASILDLEFSPFNNNILASGYSDNSVLLWNIPKKGLTKNIINKQNTIYNKHKNKVNFINFNPISSDLICSSTFDGDIHIWSVEKKDKYIDFKIDYPTKVSWNQYGNLIGVTTKSNNIHIFDLRYKKILYEKQINESSNRHSTFVWNDDYLFSTISWTKDSNYRMLYLWDIRNLNKEINSIVIDSSINTCNLFVNRELKLIYIVGKEEKKIYVYNYNDNNYQLEGTYELEDLITYSVLFNRKCLNKNNSEIDRFAIYSNQNKKINYISFINEKKKEFDNNNQKYKTLIVFDKFEHPKKKILLMNYMKTKINIQFMKIIIIIMKLKN